MLNIGSRRALATADIELTNADGSPMISAEGKIASVTVDGPGTKIWKRANAELDRRRMVRIEKAGGKLSAAVENSDEDAVWFLTQITRSFNNFTYPQEDGSPFATDKAMFEACYSDDALGFVTDHVYRKARDWAGFSNGSQSS